MLERRNFGGNIAYDDLREWLAMAERLGEVRTVKGANCEEDIGLAAEAVLRAENGPCVVFEDIPGCAKGTRLLMNMFAGTRRNMTLGFPDHLTKWELSDAYREAYLQEQRIIPHEIVDDGPVLENVMMGDDVDVTKFPAPKWHEKDGGRYIGTGTYTITRDPEENWLNAGAYRAQVHDKKTVGMVMAAGHHGRIHRDKAFKRGEPLPAAMVLGGDPIAFFFGGLEAPYGVFELDLVGGLRGRPVKMVRGKVTGLPFPANAEIVLEGYVPPDRTHAEGPFGEWTGHYAGGVREIPVLDIKAIYHRNDPIVLGVPPMGGGPDEMARYRAVMRSATIKQNVHECRRSRRAAGLVPRGRRRAHAARGLDHAALSRPRGAGRACRRPMRRVRLCVEIHRGGRRRRRRHQSRSPAVGDAHPHRSQGIDPVHHRLVGFERRPGAAAGAPRGRQHDPLGGADQRLQAVALARQVSRRPMRRARRCRARRARSSAGCWMGMAASDRTPLLSSPPDVGQLRGDPSTARSAATVPARAQASSIRSAAPWAAARAEPIAQHIPLHQGPLFRGDDSGVCRWISCIQPSLGQRLFPIRCAEK